MEKANVCMYFLKPLFLLSPISHTKSLVSREIFLVHSPEKKPSVESELIAEWHRSHDKLVGKTGSSGLEPRLFPFISGSLPWTPGHPHRHRWLHTRLPRLSSLLPVLKSTAGVLHLRPQVQLRHGVRARNRELREYLCERTCYKKREIKTGLALEATLNCVACLMFS